MNRFLKKSIAASLAFAIFTLPVSGCDFFDEDKPGGKLPASTSRNKNSAKLPEGAVLPDLPRANADRRVVEAIGMDALRYYVHARLATEKLSRVNTKKVKRESYENYLRQTAKLWKQADAFARLAARLAAELAENEKKPGYRPLALANDASSFSSPLFSVAHAALRESRPPTSLYDSLNQSSDSDIDWYHPGVSRTAQQVQQAKEKWAKRLKNAYEECPAGQRIEELAKKLGVDAKTANEQFQDAERILNKGNVSDAQLYNIGTKASLVVKGGCQTTLLIGGAILSSGATGGAAYLAAANTLAQGADLVIELLNIGHELATDESNPTLDNIKRYTGAIAAVTNLTSMVTSLKDFALRGEEAVEITHKALKEAGLKNIHGWLDKHGYGGSGVSAIIDWASWTKDRYDDYKNDGIILGFKVFDVNGKTALRPTALPKADYAPPKELSLISNDDLIQLTKQPEDLKKLLAFVDQQQDTKKRIWEIIEEDARRRQEIAEDEARREKERRQEKTEAKEYARDPRFPAYVPHPSVSNDMGGGAPSNNMGGGTAGKTEQQRPEEPSYTPSRMAGYYTVTTAKGDMAMRVILRATGGNTLSVIEVQRKTDQKGKERFAITIDPKTGKGKTAQGQPVRFEVMRDGVTFMGTLEDGSMIWRFVKH